MIRARAEAAKNISSAADEKRNAGVNPDGTLSEIEKRWESG